MGLAVGLLFLPSLSIVSHHFRARRALATGIAVSGASCGGIVFPIMLNRLFAHPAVGFANGVRVSGVVCAVLLAAANACMRTRPPGEGAGAGAGRKESGLLAVFERARMVSILRDGAYVWSAAGCVLAVGPRF